MNTLHVCMNISFLLEYVFSSGGATLWGLVDLVLKFVRTHTHTHTNLDSFMQTHTRIRYIKPSAATGSLQSLLLVRLISHHLTEN